MSTLFVEPTGGARLRVAGSLVRILASSEHTGGAYEVFELEGVEGNGPPPHRHPWSESYVVIHGEADVLIDGETQRATPGSFVHVPPYAKHTYRIATPTAKFVVIASGGGATTFFHDIDAETDGSCDDMAMIALVSRRHGVK